MAVMINLVYIGIYKIRVAIGIESARWRKLLRMRRMYTSRGSGIFQSLEGIHCRFAVRNRSDPIELY